MGPVGGILAIICPIRETSSSNYSGTRSRVAAIIILCTGILWGQVMISLADFSLLKYKKKEKNAYIIRKRPLLYLYKYQINRPI